MAEYGGMPSLIPSRIAPLLQAYGISAEPLDVEALVEPGNLTPEKFPVFVLPYGNAFPEVARQTLRAYKAAGGSLVLNGVPFTHPREERDGEWIPLRDLPRFGHDPGGLGTGGHTTAYEATPHFLHHGFQPNTLGLNDDTLFAGDDARRQALDVSSLHPEDEVIPLIGMVPPGHAEPLPVAAIVRHHCPEFRGAVDVWLGQAAPRINPADEFLARQLVTRSVAWCLAEKGAITHEQLTQIYATLDTEERPKALPLNLAHEAAPRPWGDTFLPRSKPPADEVLVVDARALRPEERTALACLQGLLSRRQPALWLHMSNRDPQWLDWHAEKSFFASVHTVEDWPSLFERFRDVYKGAIVADDALYRGNLLAANVAACEDLIIATPELAERLGIPVAMDLRDRFDTYVEGMSWVWNTYKDQLNHYLCEFIHPDRLANGAFAYSLQWRAVMFWIVGPVDAENAGSDMAAETQLVAEIMAEMAPNTPVLGFPYAGHGVGPGEVNGVTLASKYGKPLVCTDSLANACIMSGVPAPAFLQQKPPAPELERDKVYIALTVSDGDNQNTWLAFFRTYFEHPRFGEFPVAFGMGPPIVDLMPGVAHWYYEHAAPNTEFFADVSGIGYTQPENYGLAYADRDAVFNGFLGWTAEYLKKLDMGTLRTVGGGDEWVGRYVEGLPDAYAIFADMGSYSGREGIDEMTYMLEGKPVFRAVTSWRYGRDGFLREVRTHVGEKRPAFVNGFVHCWTYTDMEVICQSIYDKRDDDMVFVTPRQLEVLYRQAREQGWAE
jgi:hypothetical protein